jgi:hypothetical protein
VNLNFCAKNLVYGYFALGMFTNFIIMLEGSTQSYSKGKLPFQKDLKGKNVTKIVKE